MRHSIFTFVNCYFVVIVDYKHLLIVVAFRLISSDKKRETHKPKTVFFFFCFLFLLFIAKKKCWRRNVCARCVRLNGANQMATINWNWLIRHSQTIHTQTIRLKAWRWFTSCSFLLIFIDLISSATRRFWCVHSEQYAESGNWSVILQSRTKSRQPNIHGVAEASIVR